MKEIIVVVIGLGFAGYDSVSALEALSVRTHHIVPASPFCKENIMGTDRTYSSSDDPSRIVQQTVDRAREWLVYLHALEGDVDVREHLSLSDYVEAFLAELLELRAQRAQRGWSTAAIDVESFEELCAIAVGPLPDTSVVDDLLFADMTTYVTAVLQRLVSNRGRPDRAAAPPTACGPVVVYTRWLVLTAGNIVPPGPRVGDYHPHGDSVLYVATRTWVSGVGDDANPCSRTAPCKTFAGAISKTATGGEINCLDPGGFGGVTITKSITISCEAGTAGVLVSGTNAIVINAPSSFVFLKGLDIEGLRTGLNGISFRAGALLHVENCVIRNFNSGSAGNGFGIRFVPDSAATFTILNTTLFNNDRTLSPGAEPAAQRGPGRLGACGPTDGARLNFARLATVLVAVPVDAVTAAFIDGAAVWVPRHKIRASLAGTTLGLISPAAREWINLGVTRASAVLRDAARPLGGAREHGAGGVPWESGSVHRRRSRDCISATAAPAGRSTPRCSRGTQRSGVDRRQPDRLVSLVEHR
jgi:hypothetical protein